MKKPKRRKSDEKPPAIETEPDAWERFEKAVDKLAPVKKPKPARPKSGA